MDTTSIPPPHGFLASILPLVFSPDPVPLAPGLLSKPAAQAIHFLSLYPQSNDSYWTLGTKDPAVTLARRAVVEAGSIESLQLGDARYQFDLSGELKALVPISQPDYSSSSSSSRTDPLLNVILLWETKDESRTDSATTTTATTDDSDDRPSWTFLKLGPADNDAFGAIQTNGGSRSSLVEMGSDCNSTWYETVDEAVQAVVRANEAEETRANGRPSHLDFGQERGYDRVPEDDDDMESGRHEGAYEVDNYGVRRNANPGGQSGDAKKFKSRDEMAEGEGTTPGAYGDSADFWAGWSDSEEDGEGEAKASKLESGRGRDTEREGEGDDSAYWTQYGHVEDQVDDGRSESPVDSSIQHLPVEPSSNESETRPAKSTIPTDRPKTRSRRSSTVTPSSRLALSSPDPSLSDASNRNDATAGSAGSVALEYTSFLSLDSPSQTAAPFNSERKSLSAGKVLDHTTVPEANTPKLLKPDGFEPSRGEANASSDPPAALDAVLQSTLKGLWDMYRSASGTPVGDSEARERFKRVVERALV